jgi:hypothetical protein
MGSSEQLWEVMCRNMRAGGAASLSCLLLNVLAATITSYLLLGGSAAAVIGAMSGAMLMAPIRSIGLALVASDQIRYYQGEARSAWSQPSLKAGGGEEGLPACLNNTPVPRMAWPTVAPVRQTPCAPDGR